MDTDTNQRQSFYTFGHSRDEKLAPLTMTDRRQHCAPSPQFQLAPLFPERAPAFPITPPTTDSDVDPRAEKILSKATHVLATEATALSCLSRLYATDPLCREGFVRSVEAIVRSQELGGKVIVIGVGKSGKIGDKLVASMNSLGLMTIFLNPVEALHGDLGIVRKNDVLLLITFSGKTPELLQLLPHLPVQLPLIALTSHTSYHTLPLLRDRENAILLPAPIPESEVASFGIAAPTTSTTVAMALGDALALAAADRLHDSEDMSPSEVFRRNHPGGAIGINNNLKDKKDGLESIRAISVAWNDIPIAEYGGALPPTTANVYTPPSPALSDSLPETDMDLTDWNYISNSNTFTPARSKPEIKQQCYSRPLRVLDCLRLAAGKSPKGWLRTLNGGVIPPSKLQSCEDLMSDVHTPQLGLVLDPNDLIQIPADVSVREAASQLYERRTLGNILDDTVVVIVEKGDIYGVVEVGDVIAHGGP